MVPSTESLRFVAGELGKCGRNLEEIGAKFLGPIRFKVFLKNIAKRLSTSSRDLGHIGKLEANLSSFKTALVDKIRLQGRRGKGMAESFSREKLRHAPQKEGGWKILCDLPPV